LVEVVRLLQEYHKLDKILLYLHLDYQRLHRQEVELLHKVVWQVDLVDLVLEEVCWVKMVVKPMLEDQEILQVLLPLKEQTEDQVMEFQVIEVEEVEEVLLKLEEAEEADLEAREVTALQVQ
jgi:hypothetical protein